MSSRELFPYALYVDLKRGNQHTNLLKLRWRSILKLQQLLCFFVYYSSQLREALYSKRRFLDRIYLEISDDGHPCSYQPHYVGNLRQEAPPIYAFEKG